MTGFKRSFIWIALYLGLILILGQTDYSGRPIINFASYFYLAVMVAVPATLFFPSFSKSYVPMLFWGGIYLVMLNTLDRTHSTNSVGLPVIVIEFVLLELGVWFAQQLATEMKYAESLMDALAQGAFPNRVQDVDSEHQRIRVELTRSRRYQRPLSLLMIDVPPSKQEQDRESSGMRIGKTVQHDLMSRFSFAHVGQVIDNLIRQTDLFLKDRRGHYVVVCSETSLPEVELFAKRVAAAVKDQTGLRIVWGFASFPDEALTFEDLLQKARERLSKRSPYDSDAVFDTALKDVTKL
jgi:hypothetical protein